LSTKSYVAFADWLRLNHRTLFNALYRKAANAGLGQMDMPDLTVASTGDATSYIDTSQLDLSAPSASDIYASTAAADILPPPDLSSMATVPDINIPDSYAASSGDTPVSVPQSSSVPSAVSTVGKFLSSSQGLQTVLSAANAIASSTAAAAIITAQAQRAAAGQAPANVRYYTTQNPTTGQVSAIPYINGAPISQGQIAALQPSFLQRYGIWLILGAAALIVATG
jgi:hypothetical protein